MMLRSHVLAHLLGELLPPPAPADRHRHRTLRILLADDVSIQFSDDLLGSEGSHLSYGSVASAIVWENPNDEARILE